MERVGGVTAVPQEEYCVPVETKVGTLPAGRDTIFLDFIDFIDYDGNILILRGSLNSHTERDLAYTLAFRGVLALQILELDSWSESGISANRQTSFDEVKQSRWLKTKCTMSSAPSLSCDFSEMPERLIF